MNDYNDRPADEPDPAADDRPVAGFGWAGHNPDHHTDDHTNDHTGEQAGEHADDRTDDDTDELKDQSTDDETAGEDEPLVGEVWNDDSTAERAGEGEQGAGSTDVAAEEHEEREERAEGTETGHVGEPFGTEEPMIVTEPAADESAEDTTEAEPAEEEPVAETPESVEPVAVAEPGDVAASTADDAEPVTEPEAEPVVDGARPTAGDEFAIDYLVAPEAAERFRNRWRDVKGVFVDDPADAVRQASALSGEAVEELTAALGRLRQSLEDHWDEGKETDTERLRVALRGYGAFIDRLLTR
jgi:cell division septation protein DedD